MPHRRQESLHPIGAAVDRRLAELAMTLADLATRSGVSVTTIREIRRGDTANRSPATLAKIAKALGWTHDSIQQIDVGGGPSVEPVDSSADAKLDELLARLERIEQKLNSTRAPSGRQSGKDE